MPTSWRHGSGRFSSTWSPVTASKPSWPRIGEDLWRADRANRAADGRINERVRNEPLQQAAAENALALELGKRLLWQPSFPLPLSARRGRDFLSGLRNPWP